MTEESSGPAEKIAEMVLQGSPAMVAIVVLVSPAPGGSVEIDVGTAGLVPPAYAHLKERIEAFAQAVHGDIDIRTDQFSEGQIWIDLLKKRGDA